MYENAGNPDDLLTFLELPLFVKRWKELDLSVEFDLFDLQRAIAEDPAEAPVISGSNSLRKLRFAPKSWNPGKRGATRILYVHFEKYGVVLLVYIYAKNEKENISANVKRYLNQLIEEIEIELAAQLKFLRKQQKKKRE